MYAKEVVIIIVYKYVITWIIKGFITNLSPNGLPSAYFSASFSFHSVYKLLKFIMIATGKKMAGAANASVLACMEGLPEYN